MKARLMAPFTVEAADGDYWVEARVLLGGHVVYRDCLHASAHGDALDVVERRFAERLFRLMEDGALIQEES